MTEPMEPEPLYRYVKGSGWVVDCARVVTMSCGTVVRLEVRHPAQGERFGSVRPTDTQYVNPDGTPNETYFNWPKNTKYSYVSAYTSRTVLDDNVCLVLVKV